MSDLPGDLIVVHGGNRVCVGRRKPSGRLCNAGQRENHSAAGIGPGRGASKSASLNKAVLMRKNAQGYATTKLQVGKIQKGEAPDLDLHSNDIPLFRTTV